MSIMNRVGAVLSRTVSALVSPADRAAGFKAPRIRAHGYTVAHGKRAAAKARNVKRHKAAMRRPA
jgi:hypothetical protein